MERIMMEILEMNKHLTDEGMLADYIPALAQVNKNQIGLAIATGDGKIHGVGDYRSKFTLQSISKVITFIRAAMDIGIEGIFDKVGCDSTDEPFNAFTKLDLPYVNKPANPMINSGAILTTSLIKGDREEKFNKILQLTRMMAGNETIGVNKEVYLSEKETGSRNRSMAYLMSSKKILEGSVEEVLDTYFMQCAMEVDAVDLANIGRFISSGCEGISIEGISRKDMSIILKGLLLTCGMYNYSAKYAIDVGIPSKSGVGGGIMGVLPDGGGVGVFSPGLDLNGNSSAGLGMIKDLSVEMNYNLFDNYGKRG